ncbi:MAG: DUF932 domain-containing protein [Candidatus Riflebacteria bacterium]|nr:DUF932 domain-containing protein [Candidatus Riflebacteria bacterium]
MFREIVAKLAQVVRFDRIASTRDIKIGEIEEASGATRLALQVPTGEVVTLEPKARSQLLSNWSLPPDHFARLPRELQAAELTHFAQSQPKDVTIRAVSETGAACPTARAVLSDRYSPFDHADVLATVGPYLDGWEIQRPDVGRDEMVIIATRPEVHDVSPRKVGDLVKAGISIRNSEIGTMALGVEFTLWRLACLNGAICPEAEVSVRQRHIFVSKLGFTTQLKNAVANVAEIGQAMIAQLRASHDLLLPNPDPEAGKLQAEVAKLLKREGIWSKEFQRNASEALGSKEEASLFGLVQYITGPFAKQASMADRVARERAAGKLMALAA